MLRFGDGLVMNVLIVNDDVNKTLANLEAFVGEMEKAAADPDDGNVGQQLMAAQSIETIKWLRSELSKGKLNK